MYSWHLGHSISLFNSVSTGSSICSSKLASSNVSRASLAGSVFGGTSFVRPCLGMIYIFQKWLLNELGLLGGGE
jgi:hypothetical protein